MSKSLSMRNSGDAYSSRDRLDPTRTESVLKVRFVQYGRHRGLTIYHLPTPIKSFEPYLWCVHILFNLPVLFLMLLQEDLFLLLDLRPKLLRRRKKQLILARKYGHVVRRQCKTHGRVILLGAE